jgi:hypothetical protein
LAPKTIKKQSTLDAWVENNREIIYRKQALNSMEGQICCISCMINDDEPVSFALGDINIENELDILEKFYDYVSRLSISEWVGFNLRKFDLPWIWRHAIRYRLYELYFEIPKERFDKRVVDIMEEWSTDYNDHNSLNDIAMFLGVGGKTDGVDGSMVYDMYINGEIDKIKSYCEDDVRLTKKIYNVLFNK